MEDVEEELIMDIDGCDKKSPLAVVEYIDDLYNFYKKAEVTRKSIFVYNLRKINKGLHIIRQKGLL